MDDNVLIKIKTYQDIDGDGDEPIELETFGKFGEVNGKYYIMYKESELTGFADTTTTIKVWEDNVSVKRKGRFNMNLCYTKGEQKLCLYPTPYGEVAASIKTLDVNYEIKEGSGWIKVDYTLDPDNETFFKNSLNVKIESLDDDKSCDTVKSKRTDIKGGFGIRA